MNFARTLRFAAAAAPAVAAALFVTSLAAAQDNSPVRPDVAGTGHAAGAGRPGRRRAARAGGRLAGGEGRPHGHLPHPRPQGGGRPALRRRHARRRPEPRRLTKGDNGVWELTLGPVDPGTYRYIFNVDGVAVVDPRNPAISESNGNVWSVVARPRLADFMDTTRRAARRGRRGSTTAPPRSGTDRRMHVYTPPGYESGHGQVPGLLPAARRRRQRRLVDLGRPRQLHPRQPDRRQEGQADDRRHAGRAHRAVQLRRAGAAGRGGAAAPATTFDNDFVKDILPYVEKHYRVLTDRATGRSPACRWAAARR